MLPDNIYDVSSNSLYCNKESVDLLWSSNFDNKATRKNKWLSQQIDKKNKNKHRKYYNCARCKCIKRQNHPKQQKFSQNYILNGLTNDTDYLLRIDSCNITFSLETKKSGIKKQMVNEMKQSNKEKQQFKKTIIQQQHKQNRLNKLNGNSCKRNKKHSKNKSKNKNKNANSSKSQSKSKCKFLVEKPRSNRSSSSNYYNNADVEFQNSKYAFRWTFDVSRTFAARSGALTKNERDCAANSNVKLTFGELTSYGVTKALIDLGIKHYKFNNNDNNDINETGCVFYDLGTGSGKVPIQAFLQFKQIRKCVGIEFTQTRYNLCVSNINNLIEHGYKGRKFEKITSIDDNDCNVKCIKIRECNVKGNYNFERTCEFWCGNMFDYPNGIIDSDICNIAVDFASSMNSKLIEFMENTKIGCTFLTYHNISMWDCYNSNRKQIGCTLTSLSKNRYDVSWTSSGFPFYCWKRIGKPIVCDTKLNQNNKEIGDMGITVKQQNTQQANDKKAKIVESISDEVTPLQFDTKLLPIIPLVAAKSA